MDIVRITIRDTEIKLEWFVEPSTLTDEQLKKIAYAIAEAIKV